MDTTKAVTHVSLCAGYGGIDLGLRRAIPDLRTIAVAEIEAFACANLVAKMEAGQLDPAPIWSDLKTFPWSSFRGKVGILSGGYPCQPFSAAGKRLGADDPQHLWPFIAAGIAAMRPAVCFFENVEGHISLGLEDVLRDLQGLGYRCTFGIFSASEVGAPHQRKRIFIMAHRNDAGLERHGRYVAVNGEEGWQAANGLAWPSRPGQPQFEWEPPRVVGNGERFLQSLGWKLADASSTDEQFGTKAIGQTESDGPSSSMGDAASGTRFGPSPRPARHAALANQDLADSNGLNRSASPEGRKHDSEAGYAGEGVGDAHRRRLEGPSTGERGTADAVGSHGESGGRQAEPSLGRDADGSAGGLDYAELCISCDNRTDELRLLGNGVVPATAERAFNVLASRLFS